MTNTIICDKCGEIHLFSEITVDNCNLYSPVEIQFVCTNCNHIIYITEQAEKIWFLN